MGCETSKVKTTNGNGAKSQNNTSSAQKRNNKNTNRTASENGEVGDSARFLYLANNERHPVAMELLNEWTIFVDSQIRKAKGDVMAARVYESRAKEIWAGSDEPVSHRSVAEVGEAFNAFLTEDLTQRGWGGNFDYLVAGVAKQGFIKVTAVVEPSIANPPEEVLWEIKIHYHSNAS